MDDVERIIIAIAVLIGCAYLILFTQKKRLWMRIVAALGSLFAGGFACLFLLFFCLEITSGCNTHGQPIYSPDGKTAALVWTYDAGALGGGTSVSVYTAHGLRSSRVFSGNWLSVSERDVIWIDNSHLSIQYPSGDHAFECKSTAVVRVSCVVE